MGHGREGLADQVAAQALADRLDGGRLAGVAAPLAGHVVEQAHQVEEVGAALGRGRRSRPA